MTLFLMTVIFDYMFTSIIIGISFFTLFGHKIKKPFHFTAFLALLCAFAFVDVYYLPALFILDATIIIGNQQLAEIFHLIGPVPLTKLFMIDGVNVIIWVLQSVVAYLVGSWVYQKIYRPERKEGSVADKRSVG